MLSSVDCLAVTHFSTLPHQRYDLGKTAFLNIKHVLLLSVQSLSAKFFTLRKIRRDIV